MAVNFKSAGGDWYKMGAAFILSAMNLEWRKDRNRSGLELIRNEILVYVNLKLHCKNACDVFLKDGKLWRNSIDTKNVRLKIKYL